MGTYVDIAANDGGGFKAYIAAPAHGSGPGVVLLHELYGVTQFMRDAADLLAEDGYIVAVPDLFWRIEPGVELSDDGADRRRAFELYQTFDVDQSIKDIASTIEFVRSVPQQVGKVGAVGYCLGGLLAVLTVARTGIDCGAAYYPASLENHLDELRGIGVPFALHLAGRDQHTTVEALARTVDALEEHPHVTADVYHGAGHPFANPYRSGYDRLSADLAYARTLGVLRVAMGPHYDLSGLWDEHLRLEFAAKDVEQIMGTMVSQPYVNHVPTMTGGVGYEMLARFYKFHFVDDNPDHRVIPISRTIGINRVVDEFVVCLTHDREISWLAPNVKPTGRYLEIPIVAIVGFRGGKLHHEHIYWDQSTVLVQLGLLDRCGLPVAGVEVARKLVDENLPSNELMQNWTSSAAS